MPPRDAGTTSLVPHNASQHTSVRASQVYSNEPDNADKTSFALRKDNVPDDYRHRPATPHIPGTMPHRHAFSGNTSGSLSPQSSFHAQYATYHLNSYLIFYTKIPYLSRYQNSLLLEIGLNFPIFTLQKQKHYDRERKISTRAAL